MKKAAEKFMSWFEPKADTKSAKIWLFVLSFTESFIFPIPVDPLMAIVVLVKRNRWLYYVGLTTLASVLGGLGGYCIGYFLFELIGKPIVEFYNLQDAFVRVSEMFNENAFWAIFTAAFTPIPYKIFTIAAGVAKINLFSFILASIIGRGIRFWIVGFVVKKFGRKVYETFIKHFDNATKIVLILIILYIIFRIVV